MFVDLRDFTIIENIGGFPIHKFEKKPFFFNVRFWIETCFKVVIFSNF